MTFVGARCHCWCSFYRCSRGHVFRPPLQILEHKEEQHWWYIPLMSRCRTLVAGLSWAGPHRRLCHRGAAGPRAACGASASIHVRSLTWAHEITMETKWVRYRSGGCGLRLGALSPGCTLLTTVPRCASQAPQHLAASDSSRFVLWPDFCGPAFGRGSAGQVRSVRGWQSSLGGVQCGPAAPGGPGSEVLPHVLALGRDGWKAGLSWDTAAPQDILEVAALLTGQLTASGRGFLRQVETARVFRPGPGNETVASAIFSWSKELPFLVSWLMALSPTSECFALTFASVVCLLSESGPLASCELLSSLPDSLG